MENLWLWVAFTLFVLAKLALDLGVFRRKARAVTVREAMVSGSRPPISTGSSSGGSWGP